MIQITLVIMEGWMVAPCPFPCSCSCSCAPLSGFSLYKCPQRREQNQRIMSNCSRSIAAYWDSGSSACWDSGSCARKTCHFYFATARSFLASFLPLTIYNNHIDVVIFWWFYGVPCTCTPLTACQCNLDCWGKLLFKGWEPTWITPFIPVSLQSATTFMALIILLYPK